MRDDRIRVLVVHNDPADLAVLASVVAAHTFHLRVLESGHTLPVEIRDYRPDAVVLDVNDREVDSYELCRVLRRDPELASVALILIGSIDGPEARNLAFAAGCDDFLEKPINRQALVHRLRSFARMRRAFAPAYPTGLLVALQGVGGADRLRRACERFGGYLERVLDLLDAFASMSAPAQDATAVLEALRRDGAFDPALVSALERWLQQQSQQVVS